jgi:hypothetical protein
VRQGYRYDVRGDVAQVDLIREVTGSGALTPAPGHDGLAPIFILGMPRTGSTVVERILTSHSAVGAIGESPAFGQALVHCAIRAGVDARDGTAIIRASAGLDPAEIGATYASLTAPWAGPEPRFVDKLPGNHLYVGLIARALPRASIIHVTRHPVANLYGMYKTLFNQAYPYSYDLDELVAYYAAYRRLMAHWRDLLGERLIEVSYERLVDAPETEISALIAAYGLEWQDACLNFHDNKAPSTTQSALQVRSPLNRLGVEGWRKFTDQLEPLRQKLIAAGLMDDPLPA